VIRDICLTDVEVSRIKEKFKIPVDSFNPGTYWITSLDRESFLPTDGELRQLRSYCEFEVRSYFNERYVNRILEADLPRDNGHNTTIFRKGSAKDGTEHDWFYRKMTWRMSGSLYFPSPMDKDYLRFTLPEMMDKIQSLFPDRWAEWKEKYRDVFPPAVPRIA